MEEARLDKEFERLRNKLPFLWTDYGFKVKYFTRSYGIYDKGFIMGMENDICKLVFEKETNSPVEPIRIYIGKKSSTFTPPNYDYFAKNGWYHVSGIIYWLTGIRYENYKDVDQNLECASQYMQLHMGKLLDLYSDLEQFDTKIEYFRNLYKENQLTIENIKAERARLHALGQDSSLEVAITNLRGGKK